MKWPGAPISSCTPSRAPIWSGCPPSAAIFSTTAWQTPSSSNQWVNGLGRVSEESRAFHHGSRFAHLLVYPRRLLRTVAHMIADAERVCILWAMGVTQHSQGSDTSTAISNLLLITGNYMRPGTGAYPLRGHNNVQGASDHGAMPNMLPGYQSVDDPEVRAAIREPHGRSSCLQARDSTTTRWWTPFMRASSRRCISSARK